MARRKDESVKTAAPTPVNGSKSAPKNVARSGEAPKPASTGRMLGAGGASPAKRPAAKKKKAVKIGLDNYYQFETANEKFIGKCVGVGVGTVEIRALVKGDLSNVRTLDKKLVTVAKEVNKHVAYNLSIDADHYGG